MRRLGNWAAVLLSQGLLLSSSVAWAQTRPRPAPPITQIRGQVRFPGGASGPQGVMVLLEAERGGVVAQTQTDSAGKFSFTQIQQEVYVVRISHPGYREAYQRVDLTTGPSGYVVADLEPVSSEVFAAAERPPGATISIEQLNVPEDAKKEFEKGHRLLLESKNPQKSIGRFLKATQIHPSYTLAYLFLGTAYMELQMWPDAEAALKKAIELEEKLAVAHLALGSCLAQQGNFASAVKPLRRGLELSPDSVEGHYELARSLWALGIWQEAEPQARRAAELKADFAPVHVVLGNIALRKHDAEGALREFREYLRLDPQGPLAAPTREMVAKIEKALKDTGNRNP